MAKYYRTKGDAYECPQCKQEAHTKFEDEDGGVRCGRCFKSGWEQGDETVNGPRPQAPEEKAQ